MHGAEIPGVSHVVYPFGAKGDPDDGQEYLRCLEKRCFPTLDPLCLHKHYHTTKFRCQVGQHRLPLSQH